MRLLCRRTSVGFIQKASRHYRDLCPVSHIQLLHDVPEMHFHGVLGHFEFVGDLFVCETVADGLDDLHLPLCQSTCARRLFVLVAVNKEIARWHERAAGLDKANRLDGKMKWHACWDIAARAVTKDLRDLVGTRSVGENNNRSVGYQGLQAFKFALGPEAYSRRPGI